MLSFMIICFIWLIHSDVIYSIENTTVSGPRSFGYVDSSVTQFSVPEDHHVCLPCQGPDVIWTHQNTKVLVTRRGSSQTNQDRQRYLLLMDGGLCLLKLDDSDGGEYQCNQQLVAELQVLTGNDFQVSAGWTLLLPCRGSSKTKQRWFRQRGREKKEVIFTRFRNGTEKPERDGDRLSYMNNALQIRDLQPEDAGEYQCNGVLQARVSVLEENSYPFVSASSRTTASSGTRTDAAEVKNKTKKKHENVLMLVAVSGFVLMTISLLTVCALLISTKRRRRNRKYKYAEKGHVDTELQLWITSSSQTEYEKFERPSQLEETIHYASLGRQNWKQRPNSPPPDQNHNQVIYSSIVTRPAARNTFC
ncbi:uncharacterized protein [Nothobranchius furzeri]|uniref:LOC107394435-like protein n=4 Tax=Nothobranchius TaxID=28779 RepID=A0A9D2XYP9_NOTFU|nr:uncharacterized protein LOC107394435 [Nothobranchius furzeri]KAF7210765.1 putative LOC107394435-like protein [Nothobranchius furzeri]